MMRVSFNPVPDSVIALEMIFAGQSVAPAHQKNLPTHQVRACRAPRLLPISSSSFIRSFLLILFLSFEPPRPRGEVYLPHYPAFEYTPKGIVRVLDCMVTMLGSFVFLLRCRGAEG